MITGGPFATEAQAVLARQHHVQHDEVRAFRRQSSRQGWAVGHGVSFEAVADQKVADDLSNAGVVINNENSCGGCSVRLHPAYGTLSL